MTDRPRPAVLVAAGVLLLALALGLAEGLARLLAAGDFAILSLSGVRQMVNRTMPLNVYQRPSDQYARHWNLQPGWEASQDDLVQMKARWGRYEGSKLLLSVGEAANIPLSINADGFKGPALDPGQSRRRLLFIGDSVTFGLGAFDLVRVAEDRLTRQGLAVEAINAGVEGYAVRNALRELPRYQALRPELVVIFLGWNDIFAEDGSYGKPWRWSMAARLAIKALRRLPIGDSQVALAEQLRNKDKHTDAGDPQIAVYRQWRPEAPDRLERLGDSLAAQGSRIALATLPGLYLPGQAPSDKAIKIGHLPEFIDNPYVLAAMSESWNSHVRELADRKGWPVIDLDAWSRDTLEPRDAFFTDSVHLWPTGLGLMGEHVATLVLPLLKQQP